ncbi:alanine--tRNA ligase [Rubrivirga sp. SAORIC476]|uniref:alanine--tRNA ligase n=1 Tax=Rubrivirga sp. SAORIC476 TaxID=1961794 RepID=UPI000BA9CBB6|nr:alanine--tRNA ligase [Rubrivirga sp. SAORIC476]PAP80178.1 alanine--tRNA ligase [Rubrivirga sp. SAORIC476]
MPSRPKTAQETRDAFLAFFREKGHEIVPSAPIVPQDDPTLLFINAGMNPFKDVFLGTGTRPYVRVADTQKCLRVSGKHNDLDEVGLDTYHHTFFEMLGNWSFGDYFKREAIAWAWELLVDRWGLDADRLYVTVHEGDEALGLGPDSEAADLWSEETSIDPAHILYQSSKDNFWMMGETGPCGPCSEIHVDLRDDHERAITPGQQLVNKDDPRVMEIWNLVFIQFDATKDGEQTVLAPLADKHIDTGMGFERICAVLQGKASNYDTDLFTPILAAIAETAGLKAYDDYDEADADDKRIRVAMRVVADHVRTLAVAIADGALPGNTGRGYVLRRILRRAVRYGYQALGLREPFMASLLPALVGEMGEAFPELAETQETAARIITAEEEAFLRTLASGIEMFDRTADVVESYRDGGSDEKAYTSKVHVSPRGHVGMEVVPTGPIKAVVAELLKISDSLDGAIDQFVTAAEKGVFSGDIAFLLHDTYGFPSDLTAVMARERGLIVDEARFEELMGEQRDRARAAAGFSMAGEDVDLWDATVDTPAEVTFVGYDRLEVTGARILKTRTVGEGEEARHELVLDTTPFYAESGGQVGDTGRLDVGGEVLRVLDTVKGADGLIVHVVDRLPNDRDAEVTATVGADRRQRIMRHHTATHLLHAALRETLGTHVQQKGSLVAPDRLRFDFSHFEKLTDEERRTVEDRVNALVLQNIPKDEARDVPIDEAKARGAMALFGEKYGERVRVITFGPDISVELCGGTHVESTGEVGLFSITSEGSVASGVRRVEAVAGEAALAWMRGELDELGATRGLFKQLPDGLPLTVEGLQNDVKSLEATIAGLRKAQAAAGLDQILAEAEAVGDVRVATGEIPGADMDTLRDLAETARNRMTATGGGGVAVFGSADAEEGKAYLAASVTDDVIAQGVQAGKLVGALAKTVGGGGGGRPTLATAGGKNPDGLADALGAAADEVRAMLE